MFTKCKYLLLVSVTFGFLQTEAFFLLDGLSLSAEFFKYAGYITSVNDLNEFAQILIDPSKDITDSLETISKSVNNIEANVEQTKLMVDYLIRISEKDNCTKLESYIQPYIDKINGDYKTFSDYSKEKPNEASLRWANKFLNSQVQNKLFAIEIHFETYITQLISYINSIPVSFYFFIQNKLKIVFSDLKGKLIFIKMYFFRKISTAFLMVNLLKL